MLRSLIFLLISLTVNDYWGQGKWGKNAWLTYQFNAGFVIPEYSNITYSVNSPIQLHTLSWNKRSTGKTLTEQLYRFPEYGFSLSFGSLGNKQVFGHEISMYPYFRTFFHRGSRFAFFHQFGFGLGYATKKFHLQNNPDNISVGSHLNMHFDYFIGLRYTMKKPWIFETGIRFAHFSNANMAEPNLGLNLLYWSFGLSHAMGEQEKIQKIVVPKNEKKHEFAVIYAAGAKHTRALQSQLYFTSSASMEYKFHAYHKFHFGTGIDLFYDSATETELSIIPNSHYIPRDAFSSGFHFSQEIVFGKFSFVLQEGIHLGLKDKVHTSLMYNRAMLRWKCNEHLLVHLTMKSHLHILDYPELGIGYYFLKNP